MYTLSPSPRLLVYALLLSACGSAGSREASLSTTASAPQVESVPSTDAAEAVDVVEAVEAVEAAEAAEAVEAAEAAGSADNEALEATFVGCLQGDAAAYPMFETAAGERRQFRNSDPLAGLCDTGEPSAEHLERKFVLGIGPMDVPLCVSFTPEMACLVWGTEPGVGVTSLEPAD